jgi:hypothetical protein
VSDLFGELGLQLSCTSPGDVDVDNEDGQFYQSVAGCVRLPHKKNGHEIQSRARRRIESTDF